MTYPPTDIPPPVPSEQTVQVYDVPTPEKTGVRGKEKTDPPRMNDSLRANLGSYQLKRNLYDSTVITCPAGTVHPDTGVGIPTYLIPHAKERLPDFEQRRTTSFTLPFTREIVETYVSAMFHQEVNRDKVVDHFGDDIARALMGNIDGQKHSIRWWLKHRISTNTQIFGWCAVVVDMPPKPADEPDTAFHQRALPYARVVPPLRLWDWSIDSLTGDFYYALIQESDDRWRAWSPDHSALIDHAGDVLSVDEHDFGIVPVFLCLNEPSGCDDGMSRPFGISTLEGVDRIALHVYQLCSHLSENELKTLFTFLHEQKDPAGKRQSKSTSPPEVELGESYMFRSEASVSWVVPPSDIPKTFIGQLDFYTRAMFRGAGIWTGTEMLHEQHSGEALAWMFSDKILRVGNKGEELETSENRLWSMMSYILGVTERDDVLHLVTRPRDYSVTPVNEELGELERISVIAKAVKDIFAENAAVLIRSLLRWAMVKTKRVIVRDIGHMEESRPIVADLSDALQDMEDAPTPAPAQEEEIADAG